MSEGLMPVRMTVRDFSQAVQGRVLCGDLDMCFSGISTDTREDLTGKLFVPFAGENHDAHDFLEQAVKKGANVILLHRNSEALKSYHHQITVVEVADTLQAFQRLATFWRRKMQATIIGITGSNGKTTTKEFAAKILAEKFSVYWSQKSFNNHWGVPISLLSVQAQHQCALIEMGMNHLGELKTLCEIAEPDVAIVTFVGASHLEGLGSVEGVARGKEEIYEHSPRGSCRIYNLDNAYTLQMYEKAIKTTGTGRILRFSQLDSSADVMLKINTHGPEFIEVSGTIGGVSGQTRIPVFGAHNIVNVMAASAIALAVGMDGAEIWATLPRCRNAWGRGQWLQLAVGAKVLFDGYNANPESMKALIGNFSSLKGNHRKFAVIGEMKELGAHSQEEHRKLGVQMGSVDWQGIWFVGNFSAAFRAGLISSGFKEKLLISDAYEESLALEFASMLEGEDIVAVKGSRGVALEKVLRAWGLQLPK